MFEITTCLYINNKIINAIIQEIETTNIILSSSILYVFFISKVNNAIEKIIPIINIIAANNIEKYAKINDISSLIKNGNVEIKETLKNENDSFSV